MSGPARSAVRVGDSGSAGRVIAASPCSPGLNAKGCPRTVLISGAGAGRSSRDGGAEEQRAHELSTHPLVPPLTAQRRFGRANPRRGLLKPI